MTAFPPASVVITIPEDTVVGIAANNERPLLNSIGPRAFLKASVANKNAIKGEMAKMERKPNNKLGTDDLPNAAFMSSVLSPRPPMKKIAKREIVFNGVFDNKRPGAGIRKPNRDITTSPTGRC